MNWNSWDFFTPIPEDYLWLCFLINVVLLFILMFMGKRVIFKEKCFVWGAEAFERWKAQELPTVGGDVDCAWIDRFWLQMKEAQRGRAPAELKEALISCVTSRPPPPSNRHPSEPNAQRLAGTFLPGIWWCFSEAEGTDFWWRQGEAQEVHTLWRGHSPESQTRSRFFLN